MCAISLLTSIYYNNPYLVPLLLFVLLNLVESSMANWSELPEDIISLFLERLPPCIEEFARFGCVSKSWRNALINHKARCRPCTPWLMLTTSDNDMIEEKQVKRCFNTLSTQRFFSFSLPQAQGRRCWGTPHGWLFTLGLDLEIHLLHPLSGVQISLPPQPTFFYPEGTNPLTPHDLCVIFIRKFAVASNPSSWTSNSPRHSSLVAALYGIGSKIAVAAPEDKAWTLLESPLEANQDIIFFNGHFYAVSCRGVLRICELDASPPKATDFAAPPDDVDPRTRFYLVEMSGDLHLIERCHNFDEDTPWGEYHYDTDYFYVYKFDFQAMQWDYVFHLDDHTLFVGNNTSFAISTSDYPQVKPNCIYFTDDYIETYEGQKWCDMGVHDHEEKTTEPIHHGHDKLSKFSRPVFFMPTL